MNNRSLRTKIIVLVFLITAIPLTIVGIGNYTAAKSTVMEGLHEQACAKVHIYASSLSSWIATRLAEVEVMSRTSRVRSGSAEERNNYFREEVLQTQPDFVSIGFVGEDGILQLSDGRRIQLRNEPWFGKAMAGQSTVSNPFLRDGKYLFVIQVPVYAADRQIVGIVNAALRMEGLSQKFLDFPATKDDHVMLFNQQGMIVDYPDPQIAMERTLFAKDLPYAEAAPYLLERDEGYVKLQSQGERAMVFFAAVNGTPWKIAMKVPLNEFEAPLASLLGRTILTIALAEAVITLFLLLLTNQLLKRVKRVLYVTEAASAGRFDVEPVPEAGQDELAQLSYSVNTMSARLRESFERMEAIINQNEYAFIMLDDQYRVTYFSKAAEKMLGYRAEEVLGTATALTFIDEADLQQEASELSARLGRGISPGLDLLTKLQEEHGVSYEREWKFVRKDGTAFPVVLSSNGIRNRDGHYIGLVGIARDITGLKEAEKAQNQQLRVLEAAKDLIAIFDDRGRLLYMNTAGHELLGLTRVEPHIAAIEQTRLMAALLENIGEVSLHGFMESETCLYTKDGRGVHVSKILVAHRDEGSGEMFISCIARDITEQKRVQSELEAATREAEEASQATSDFLARMSHEIRTPLAGIIGLIRLLQKTSLSELQRDYLDKMHASSDALLHIINDILDFAKAEAGKIELSEVTFKPEQLIQKLADLLSMFVGGKEQFEFLIEIPDELPGGLIGDALRLEQVLLNLCVNAIKFTSHGHVRLRLSLVEKQAEYAAICFEVEDTGIGISDEQLAKLFEPFTQAGSATSRKYGGTGLGLVIAKSLVEMMGGAIGVESKQGAGSRFYFTLRFAIAGAMPKGSPHLLQTGNYAAWVVEDYPLSQLHWNSYLEDMGLLPILFSSWRSAQERLVRAGIGGLPDVVLLDFEMPDMYGSETWQSFREVTRRCGVMTIALTTAFGREELLKLPQDDRPEAILVKPVGKLALRQALSVVLSRRPSERLAGAVESAAALEQKCPSKGTILLTEDNAINQLVAVELLREWGFVVEVAETGEDTLRLLDEGNWDLILMDIHMPDMDGDEVARIIRSEPRFDRLPIIALTANVIRQDHERYIQLGMNDVLTKPIDAEKMHQVIDKWIRRGGESRLEPAGTEAVKVVPALPVIAGLNVAEALERVNGKRHILRHMLELFVRDYCGFEERLLAMLAAGSHAQARRMAHTLKGVAGNLSAAGLTEKADRLESLLKLPEGTVSEAEIQAAVRTIGEELNPLLKKLGNDVFDSLS
ncbi:response regulator [Paenibacillus sp. GCM10027626]|uniref:response regulator n=1 Tax=Paenibacillus sp. GCM10027626 TaxID=3273411 RepID=UPI00363A303C